MHQAFWLELWQNNTIGFHSEEINSYLVRHWPGLELAEDCPVLVPLCGKSKDMLWLAGQGHDVLGMEISPFAVSAFFSENGLTPDTAEMDGFTVHKTERLSLYCGDLFNLPEAYFSGIKAVYDRAALVALPPLMRTEYVRFLQFRLKPGAQILLVSFVYSQDEMAGPPFSVSGPEVEDLFGGWCNIRLLETKPILDEEPRFKAKGLSALEEQVYALTVK